MKVLKWLYALITVLCLPFIIVWALVVERIRRDRP